MKRLPRAVPSLVLLLVILSASTAPLLAEDYQGAKTILKKLRGDKSAASGQVPAAAKKLDDDIRDFSKKSVTLSPATAAKTWIELLDRAVEAKGSQAGEQGLATPSAVSDVLGALPPPSSWDEIARIVEARPVPKASPSSSPAPAPAAASFWSMFTPTIRTDIMRKDGRVLYEEGLRLVAHTLAGSKAARQEDAEALAASLNGNPQKDDFLGQQVTEQLSGAIMADADDPGMILKALDDRLATFKSADAQQLLYRTLDLPDLVTIFGKEKAGEILRHALKESPVTLNIDKGHETRILARDIALEMAGDLKAPQWELACTLDGGPLFEALSRRFPLHNTTQSYDASHWKEAQSYYLFGLIAHQQTKQAVALAKEMGANPATIPYNVTGQLEGAGYLEAVRDFFFELLSDNPGLPFWGELIQVSARTGSTDKLLDLARKSIARGDLSPQQRAIVESQLYKVLLASGQIEEGVKELQKLVAGGAPPSTVGDNISNNNNFPALKLARIGMLVGNKDWIEEGIAATRRQMALESGKSDDSSQTAALGLAELLVELGRGPEAESVLADALLKLPPNEDREFGGLSYSSSGKLMLALLRLYSIAGRHDDVIALLDEAPNWGTGDLSSFFTQDIEPEMVTEFSSHAARADSNAGFIAASALFAKGRKEQAEKIINAVLDRKGGFDPAYELLLQMEGQKAIPRLDELFARDQFECRPLIWKATLLKDAGRLDAAEKCVRQAISIDPSDGEQGPGRRMRAYAVLADIRAARGDAEQARFFHEVVNAIRLSEKADRFYEAGMLSRAVAMYEDALTHFSDAYCIQSRLALRLSELGKNEEAEEHYRKAYELMPESFGRVESHCFGCERAFAGKKAQGIAEKVFSSLAEKMPDKPQVHYLLGYLRFEQDDYKGALPHFQTAVKLDPQYLNAWKEIQSIGGELRLPAADRDAVTFNILRLDPFGRHSSSDFKEVGDLHTLWKIVEDSAAKRPPSPGSLYPLVASSAVLAKTEHFGESWISNSYYSDDEQLSLTPAKAVWRNGFLQAVGSMLDNPMFSVPASP